MEHPFFTTAAATRAEALRWLSIAEKLLSARDLMGSKSFATRARDADPSLSAADEILAVADTLLAGDRRIGSNQPDFYAVLRLAPPQGRDGELLANQYRGLVLLLNPQRNRFPFADQAFRLVIDAWSVLSNPSRKALYDKEIGLYQHLPDPFSVSMPSMQQQFIFTQPQMHGAGEGGSSTVAASLYVQPQQLHLQPPRVGPMFGGPGREPQNFMGYPSGTNLVFGSGSGSRSSHEPVNNQVQENYSTFAGYMPPASETTQEQLNINNNIFNKEKQPELDFSNVGENDSNIHSVKNVSETVEETIEEDEENVDDRTMEEEEEEDVEEEEEEEEMDDSPANDDDSTFWTACPYCYYMYQYHKVYVDSTMRCQNCKRAFQAVVIPSPPPVVDGQEEYFCCWGFLPLGFSAEIWEKNKGAALKMGNTSGRRFSAPRVYVDDEDIIFADISSSSESDVDWQDDRAAKRKFKANSVKGSKEATVTATPNRRLKKVPVDNKGKNVDMQEAVVSPLGLEMPDTKLGTGPNGRKQPNRAAKSFGKLDLNVELSNEADEPAPSANKGNGPVRREDDNNIEGIGFFEGLDELFSNLPILNVVPDDKVVKAA